jgi:hypothetical protein
VGPVWLPRRLAWPSVLSVCLPYLSACLSVCLSVTATPRQGYLPLLRTSDSALPEFSRRSIFKFLFHSSPTIASPSRRDVYYASGWAATTCQLCIVRHGPHVFAKFHPSYYVPPLRLPFFSRPSVRSLSRNRSSRKFRPPRRADAMNMTRCSRPFKVDLPCVPLFYDLFVSSTVMKAEVRGYAPTQ